MDKYIILPGCDDGNRGDQALVWETKKIAENAGFVGEFSMLCAPDDLIHSKKEGINTLNPILGHPSRKFKNKDNSKYTFLLLLKWGSVAIGDWIGSSLIHNAFTRKLIYPFLSSETKKTLKAFKECKACFVKGGGFIHSYGKITDIYTMYYFLYHIRLANALQKPVYIMPNSFGPFIAPTVKKQVKKTLSQCRLVTTRESVSSKMLSDIGINNQIFPDLAFGLKKNTIDVFELQEVKNLAGNRSLIGVTARPYRFPNCENSDEKYKNYVYSLGQFCNWLFNNGYFPVLIEHVLSNNTNEKDIKGIEDVANYLKEQEYYILSNKKYNCRDLKYIYSQMDAVIGTRFHSVIFSLSENVPCLAITYGGNKGIGIMSDIGLDEYSIAIEDVTFEELKSKFALLTENLDEYKTKLASHVQISKQAIQELEVQLTNQRKEENVIAKS